MKAKQVFQRLNEAGEGEGQMLHGKNPPPGTTSGSRRIMHDPRMMRPPGGMRPEPMQGPFSTSDMSKLKDVMLLVLCKMCRSAYDEQIVRHLMSGQPPEPGQIQHILDEVGQVGELPESHTKVLRKAYEWTQQQPSS